MEVIPLNIKSKPDKTIINTLAPKQSEDDNTRMLVVGQSGAGKTYATISLILNHMKCQFLFVCAKTLNVSKAYKALREIMDEREKEEGGKAFWMDTLKEIFRPEELNNQAYNVVIFDDMMNQSPKEKRIINEFFTNGRQAKASVIALIQDYKGLPPTVRQNANYLMLFKGISDDNLEAIRKDYAPSLTKNQFRNIYYACISREYGFLFIDKDAKNPHEQFRYKFDALFDPSQNDLTYLPHSR